MALRFPLRRTATCGALSVVLALLPFGIGHAENVEGTVDLTFDEDGQAPQAITYGGAHAVAIQPDGKIVVAITNSPADHVSIARYTTAGALEFGTYDDLSLVGISENAIALQSDGKIVVGGTASNGANLDMFVVRYSSAGALDTSFGGGDGYVLVPVGSGDDVAQAMLLQPDGKIVLAGFTKNTDNYKDFALARLTTAGVLDGGFGTGGIVTNSFSATNDEAHAVALQPDGSIVTGGTQWGSSPKFALTRFSSAGVLDTAFGSGGLYTLDIGGFDSVRSILIQPDGMILMIGEVRSADDAGWNIGMVRFDPAANQRDPSFGNLGIVNDRPGLATPTTAFPYAAALQADGRIILAGHLGRGYYSDPATGDHYDNVMVARYLPTGSRDTSFGNGGVTETNLYPSDDNADAVALGPDGTIVVSGTSWNGYPTNFLLRYIGDATAPWGARVFGLPRYSMSAHAAWWTASDTGTGVKSYDVQRRAAKYSLSGYGGFAAVLSATPNPGGTVNGSPGYTYCYRARARDYAGNVGVYSAADTCTAYPLDDRALAAQGTWSNLTGAGYYLKTARSSTSAGAKLSIAGVYRHLAVVVTTCQTCGTLKVLRGTTLLKTITLASSTTVHRKVVEVASSSTALSATIVLRQSSGGKPVIVEGLAFSLA